MTKNPYDEMKTMTLGQIRQGLGLQAMLFIGIGVVLWSLSGRDIIAFVSIDLQQVTLGLALAAGLIGLAAALFHGFPRLAERLVRMQARNFAFLEKRLSMPMIVFISLCAGIGEEALFRAGLQTVFGDYLPAALAIALSSALFTLIHFSKAIISAILFVVSCLFGIAYLWSGSVLAVMIAHAIYDVYALWYLQREMHRLGVFESSPEPSIDSAG